MGLGAGGLTPGALQDGEVRYMQTKMTQYGSQKRYGIQVGMNWDLTGQGFRLVYFPTAWVELGVHGVLNGLE